MYYQISETLLPSSHEKCLAEDLPYVIVLTIEEWQGKKEDFQIHLDLDFHIKHFSSTKAEVNADAITGSFSIPDRYQPASLPEARFAFALTEAGIIFIGEHPILHQLIDHIYTVKRWRNPSLERFLYDFIEGMMKEDARLLEGYQMALNELEDQLLEGYEVKHIHQLNAIRRDFTVLDRHYEQLMDVAQELFENENGFFAEENLRYFHLLLSRISRLQTLISVLHDHVMQIRDLHRSQMDAKQNKLMSMLTIVTTCCLPLNILVGWYGMNFKYMPELSQKWAYPVIIIVAITLFSGAIYYFKKKKWL